MSPVQVVHQSTASSSTAAVAGWSAPALADFPQQGAMRPLADSLMSAAAASQASSEPGGSSAANTGVSQRLLHHASTAAVLAASPWLPHTSWGATLSASLTLEPAKCSSGASNVPADTAATLLRLQLETINIALRHGSQAGAGLGAWLADLLAPRAWARLPRALQVHLLLNVPAALRTLPAAAQQQMLRCALSTIDSSSADATLLQCAACIGVCAAARVLCAPSGVQQGQVESTSAKRAQEHVLGALADFVRRGPVLPAAWAVPSVAVDPPPADVHWRLVCSAHEWQPCTTMPSEAAISSVTAACRRVIPSAHDDVAAPDSVLTAAASGRASIDLPQAPSAQQLAHWAWHALAALHGALPAKLSLRLLSELRSGTTPPREVLADSDARPAPQRAWAQTDASEADPGPATAPGAGELRASVLLALRAAAQPTSSDSPLRRLIADLAAQAPSATAATAEATGRMRIWRAACCAAAAAVASASVACQRDVLTDLLRTVWAQQRADSADADASSAMPWQMQLSVAAVIAWELSRRVKAHGATEGLPWCCDALDDDATAASSEVAGGELPMQGLRFCIGSGWAQLVDLLPWTLPRLLRSSEWSEARGDVLSIVSNVWQAATTARGQSGDPISQTIQQGNAESALAGVLEAFWNDLQPHEQAALLPVLSVGEL